VFRNSFKDIETALRTLNKTGARYEFECYDTSHLYNLSHFLREWLLTPEAAADLIVERLIP
jgi:uncharacterized protein (DUF849 family)